MNLSTWPACSKITNYLRYCLAQHTSCNNSSLWQDQLQTCGMPTANFNSQPHSLADTDSEASSLKTEMSEERGVTVVSGIVVLSADLEGNVTGCDQAALNM